MNLLIAVMATTVIGLSGKAFRASAQQDKIAGGFGDADKTDPEIVSAARFAIKQQRRKLGQSLLLVSIERAEIQVVAGLNYRLCLKVNVKGKTQEVTAVVYRDLKQKYSLSRWDVGSCKAEP